MAKSKQTPTKSQLDQRSRALNPNSSEFKMRMDHHADQLNDNDGTSGTNTARQAIVENKKKQLNS